MKSQGDLISDFEKGKEKGEASHMYIEGDVLYSYGRHFPMLVRMKHWGKGKFLLNADRYSSTTSRHQMYAGRIATVQIPFSALNGALNDDRGRMRWPTNGMEFDPAKLHLIDKGEERYDKTGRYTPVHYGSDLPVLSEKEYLESNEALQGLYRAQTERRPEACVIRYGRRYYLSSMDGANYFISLLPRKVASVDEAFEVLKPVEINGSTYERQGEWFFIPVSVTIPKKEIQKKKYLQNKVKGLPQHHYVRDYVVHSDYPYPLVRGSVRHDRRDHRMLKLGEEWHMAIESNHRGSWGASGAVD